MYEADACSWAPLSKARFGASQKTSLRYVTEVRVSPKSHNCGYQHRRQAHARSFDDLREEIAASNPTSALGRRFGLPERDVNGATASISAKFQAQRPHVPAVPINHEVRAALRATASASARGERRWHEGERRWHEVDPPKPHTARGEVRSWDGPRHGIGDLRQQQTATTTTAFNPTHGFHHHGAPLPASRQDRSSMSACDAAHAEAVVGPSAHAEAHIARAATAPKLVQRPSLDDSAIGTRYEENNANGEALVQRRSLLRKSDTMHDPLHRQVSASGDNLPTEAELVQLLNSRQAFEMRKHALAKAQRQRDRTKAAEASDALGAALQQKSSSMKEAEEWRALKAECCDDPVLQALQQATEWRAMMHGAGLFHGTGVSPRQSSHHAGNNDLSLFESNHHQPAPAHITQDKSDTSNRDALQHNPNPSSSRVDALLVMRGMRVMMAKLKAETVPSLDQCIEQPEVLTTELIAAAIQEFKIWDASLCELVRQEMPVCSERASCLALIRSKLVRLFQSFEAIELARTESCISHVDETLAAVYKAREAEIKIHAEELQLANNKLVVANDDLVMRNAELQTRLDEATAALASATAPTPTARAKR